MPVISLVHALHLDALVFGARMQPFGDEVC